MAKKLPLGLFKRRDYTQLLAKNGKQAGRESLVPSATQTPPPLCVVTVPYYYVFYVFDSLAGHTHGHHGCICASYPRTKFCVPLISRHHTETEIRRNFQFGSGRQSMYPSLAGAPRFNFSSLLSVSLGTRPQIFGYTQQSTVVYVYAVADSIGAGRCQLCC